MVKGHYLHKTLIAATVFIFCFLYAVQYMEWNLMMTYKKLHLTTIISMGSEMTKYYG